MLIILIIIQVFPLVAGVKNDQIEYTLSYIYDEKSQIEVPNFFHDDFIEVQKYPFNNGLKNGTYWIKLELTSKDTLPCNYILEIKEPYIKKSELWSCCKEDSELLYQTGNDFLFKDKPIANRNIAYPVVLHKGMNNFLIKVSYHRNVSFIFYVKPEKEYYLNEIKAAANAGVYYGFALLIIALNIFFYFSIKDKMHLYYLLIILPLCIVFLHLDGYLFYIMSPGWWSDNIDIIAYCMLAIAGGPLFMSSFMHLKIHHPHWVYFEYALMFTNLLIFGLFLYSHNVIYFALGLISLFILVLYYWVHSIFLIKKHKYALFITVGYAALGLVATFYAIPIIFGYDLLNQESSVLKVGSMIEMSVFLYSIMYRNKILIAENQKSITEVQNFVHKFKVIESELINEKLKHKHVYNFSKIQKEYDLTSREIEVLPLIVKGCSNPEIADSLCISVNTVKYHVRNIYIKLDINDRKEALRLCN